MVLNLQFGMTGCHAIAAGIASGLTLLGACVLIKTSDDDVGRFVAHASVYLYALPLGLGGALNAQDDGLRIGAVVAVLVIVLVWSILAKHALMSDVVIPIISLCCVAGLYRIPERTLPALAILSAGWCLVLGLLSLVPKKEKASNN